MFTLEPLGKFAIEVTPKQPFIDWLAEIRITSAELLFNEKKENSSTLYMIPAEFAGYLDDFLIEYFDVIFTNELGAWIIEEYLWPSVRNLALFNEWFNIQTHDFCWDLTDETDDGILLWNSPN